MKPVVETRAIETQTDSEPIKTFATMDTQTDQKETNSICIQTESADTKDGSMQTTKTLTDTVEI